MIISPTKDNKATAQHTKKMKTGQKDVAKVTTMIPVNLDKRIIIINHIIKPILQQ